MNGQSDLISNAAIQALKVAHKQASQGGTDYLEGASRDILEQMYAPIAHFVDAMENMIYDSQSEAYIEPAVREKCIITLLAAEAHLFPIAVHVYWALVLGVTPTDIYNHIVLTAMYKGIDNFTMAMGATNKTLGILQKAFEDGEDLHPGQVLQALGGAFNT